MAETLNPEELRLLIEQTYKVENDFIHLKAAYAHLQGTIETMVEFSPNALWILSDEDGTIFLENSRAKTLRALLGELHFDEEEYELAFESRFYLIKLSRYQQKHLVSATDITEQKRKENLATMGQMAAHLSHEIRNPIGSIALLASTLMKRVIPQNKPIVLEIQKSIYRIERIIKSTLMFSKGVKTTIVPVQWQTLLREIETAIGYYSYAKAIRFDLPQHAFMLQGDIDLLSMLFTNFIFNAIDAIEADEDDEGVINLTHRIDGGYHRFEIYDSGVPIENVAMLFEAFKSTKQKGNGLGLLLCKQIAQAHGGEVGLCDGSRKGFYISLKA